MSRLLNGFLLLCMFSAPPAFAQDDVLPKPDDLPAVEEAPTAGIILIETSGEPSHKLYQKVADALKSKGVKVLPGDDPIGKPVRLQAEIHAAPETSTETILDLIKSLKSLSVERFSFAATPQDGDNQILVICPADITYRRVRTITEAIMKLNVIKEREFDFDVRVAGSNDPVTPVEVPTYEDPNAPVPASRDIFCISPEGKSKLTKAPPAENSPTPTVPQPSGRTQQSPQFDPGDSGYDTTSANPQAPRYNPYRQGDPTIIPPQPVPSYSPYAPAKPKLTEPQVKIFRLQQADVASVGKIVEQLLSGDPHNSLTVVPDERTNSLIVRGEEKLLLEVEAIVLRLDEPGSKTDSITARVPALGPAPAPVDFAGEQQSEKVFSFYIGFDQAEPSAEELRKQYTQLEQKAKELAARQRNPLPDPATGDNWNAQLRTVVEQAFTTRQKLQRAELAEFARRLQKIQQSIEQREKLQKQIIDRRVEELLDPIIEWNASTPVESQAIKSLQQTESWIPYSEAAPDSDQQSSEDLGNLFSRTPPSPDSKLLLGKSPEEMHELLLQHSKQISQIKESIQRWENKRDEESDAENARNSMEQLKGQLVEYQRKQALAHAEYEEQLKYLESVLILQQTALSVAENNVQFAQRLQQKGYVSAGEIEREKIKLQDATVAVQRTESLLKLYRQAGTGLIPEAEQPDERAEQSQQTRESTKAELRDSFVFRFPESISKDVRTKHPESIPQFVDISPDGKLVVSVINTGDSYTCTFWNFDSGESRGRSTRLGSAATVLFSNEGSIAGVQKFLANEIDCFDAASGRFLETIQYPRSVSWKDVLNQFASGNEYTAPKRNSLDLLLPRDPGTSVTIRKLSDEETFWQVFGAKFEQVDQLPDSNFKAGLKITEIRAGGPATEAELRVGDIVVGIDKWEIKSLKNLDYAFQETAAENPVKVHAVRGNENLHAELSWAILLEPAPISNLSTTIQPNSLLTEANHTDQSLLWEAFGAKFKQVETAAMYREWNFGNSDRPIPAGGVQITELREKGPAELARLNVGDVIVGMDKWLITKIDDIYEVQKMTSNHDTVKIIFGRENETFIAHLKWETTSDVSLLWQVFGARFERTDKLPSEDYYFGLQVIELRPDGPAEKAGIEIGDIVVQIDRSKTTLLHNLSSPYKRAVTLKSTAQPVTVSLFRGEELMSLDLNWSEAEEKSNAESNPLRDTPEAVLNLLQRYGEADDYENFVGLLTDEEADRFAGMLLQSANIMGTVSQLVANASPNDPQLAKLSQITSIAAQHRRQGPSVEALAAYEALSVRSLSGIFAQFGASSAQPPVESLNATDYSKQLRLSAGILKDPRVFSAEMMLVMSKMNPKDRTKPSKSPKWKIEITGDTAVATSELEPAQTNGFLTSSSVDLQKIEGQWWISSLMSDENILEFAKGGTVTQSQPATEPLPVVQDSFNSPSAPAAVPVRQADTPGSPIVEPVVAPAATPLSEKSLRKLEGIWTPTHESRKLLDPELLKKGDEADLKITVDTTLGDSLPKQGNWDKFLSQSKTYWGGSDLTVLATGLVGHPAASPETHHNFYMVLRNGAGKTFLQIGLVFGASPELELSGEGAHSLLSLVWKEQDSSLSPISPDVESQKIEYRPREEKR